MVFVDLKKAFDRFPRELSKWLLQKKRVLKREIKAIKNKNVYKY